MIFADGESVEADHLILCTGYKMDLSYLQGTVKETVVNEDNNDLTVSRHVTVCSAQSYTHIGNIDSPVQNR